MRSCLLFLLCLPLLAMAADYDLVINNGRVIDPESGLDKILHVAIKRGRIAAISPRPLAGKQNIDATDKVVTAGFIDIHSHTPTLLGQHLNLLDGITTQLDLEAGAFPVHEYGEHYVGGAQLHYGSSVAHFAVRMKVIEGVEQPYIFHSKRAMQMAGNAWSQPATDDQINAMRALLHEGLDQGGLGIGVLLDYMTSAVTAAELQMIFAVAAEREVPVTIHVRRGMPGDPAGLLEVIDLAQQTGAATLICHITHNAMGRVGDWLAMIDQANRDGANISAETLSYAAGGTSISADVFRNRDWRRIFDIDYSDVQWVATGEWLTEESWERYAREQPRGMVNHHYIKEAWIETALQWPAMMVSTDALPAMDLEQLTNPNIAGTFSRVLGHYVRDRKLMSLSEGLARLSYHQARWLQQAAPQFARKGRVQAGADADIVIFDPQTVAANATYGKPYETPTGIEQVIVAGRLVVADGQRIEGRYPGRRLLGKGALKPRAQAD
ncbi:MAG: amidohydrolase family protein [Gammaproteobacteria bacterium]|nr:amidohydrolase family protein [Gammaproteobacteria bacterium]